VEKIIDKIESPQDLRRLKLTIEEKKQLAQEIRNEIIENVSKTGGHLASNLGVVELTIAIHDIFNTPEDKVIWDVGHQAYVHKILTGRRRNFSTLRQLNGMSGFPKVSESEYDVFNTGHSSTSISAALGMARARDIKNEKFRVVAVIGDGAMTGGMALEALNDAGASNTDLIVILNDNEMSIERNTGGLSMALSRMRTRKFYTNSNKRIKNAVGKIPKVGNSIIRFVRKLKYSIKQLVLPNMMFEDIGFKYLGPVDGNDIEKMEEMLKKAKDLTGPVLIHCKTVKGKGYEPAEKNPDKFHSASQFDIETGKSIKEKKKDYSKAFGDKLVSLAKKNKNIVAITAAMTSGTGLTKFKEEYPDRFFDVEIAEQHALTMAAGMASQGLVPVVAIYSSFLQRAYDQIIHDICMQNLHVVMCIDRAGIVGADGETHQGLLDMAFLRIIPNITIMAPQDFQELENMMDFAINKMNTPVAIRYPRGGEKKIEIIESNEEQIQRLENKKAKVLKTGQDATIVAIGKMVERALEVSNILEKDNIKCDVINASFIKPLDANTIKESIVKTKKLFTIEDGTIEGGLYTEVLEMISNKNLENIQIHGLAYNDKFVQHGTPDELEKMNGLDAESIAEKIKSLL
jgi:1-deoxy-D-xylulose-5-phosphate synthase